MVFLDTEGEAVSRVGGCDRGVRSDTEQHSLNTVELVLEAFGGVEVEHLI